MSKPKTSKEAQDLGLKEFFPDTPCKNGHLAARKIVYSKRWLTSRCVECQKDALEKSQAHPDEKQRKAKRSKDWKDKNPSYDKEWRAERDVRNRFLNLLSGIKSRCGQRGLPFDLDVDYLESIFPKDGLCPILGEPMILGPKNNQEHRQMRASIDRLVPEKGYVKGNVAFLSVKANAMKQDISDPDIFHKLGNWVEEQLKKLHKKS